LTRTLFPPLEATIDFVLRGRLVRGSWNPRAGLDRKRDQSGNLYGATTTGGSGGGGTVFELTPSGSGWTFTLIYSFTGGAYCGPRGNLVMDGAGNLYGTTRCDGTYNQGSVFKLTPSSGGWTESDLYDFTGGSDGGSPFSNVVIDANGNLYGTTPAGGFYSYGVVWEITP